jgi:hypothetical protein
MSAESPNSTLDTAIKKLLKDAEDQPFDMRCKAINSAVAWEKAKHSILDKDAEFDPDSL